MCLAIPVRVEKLLDNEYALINMDGVQKQISLSLVEGVREGDYVILHVGYALTRLDPDEASKTLQLFSKIANRLDSP